MIFKKFIGALTALVMTMTAFVGLATEVGAKTILNTDYDLIFNFNNQEIYRLDGQKSQTRDEYLNGITNLVIDEGTNAGTYIVNSHTVSEPVLGNITSSGEDTIITTTITYTFNVVKLQTFTVNITGDGNGTVSVAGATPVTTEPSDASSDNSDISSDNTRTYTAAAGTPLTINVNADDNSYIVSNDFTGISGIPWNGNEQAGNATITMPADNVTLKVEFGKYYNITPSSTIEDTGSFSVSTNTAKEGETVSIFTDPSQGHEVTNVIVKSADGSIMDDNNIGLTGSGNTYTFIMPATDVTIQVVFTGQLPNTSKANHVSDYTEFAGSGASYWMGTITGIAGSSFYPAVKVTLDTRETKTAVSNTTVTGASTINIAVVVDKIKDEINTVELIGLSESLDSDSGASFANLGTSNTDNGTAEEE